MGPMTKVYQQLIIDKAKSDYFIKHSKTFNSMDFKIKHIELITGEREGCFMLLVHDITGKAMFEEVFKYSDF